MHDVVELGLLKMDFLGLRNLDVIDKAVELAGGLEIGTLPLDDCATHACGRRVDRGFPVRVARCARRSGWSSRPSLRT